MGQIIGNVGLLNLLNATEQSVKAYEKIGNVGAIIYKAGQSHLLGELNIGNIGKTIELPEGYSYSNGILHIDSQYIQSVDPEKKLLVNGIVIFERDVQKEELKEAFPNMIVNGEVFAPAHLTGIISGMFSQGSATVKVYKDAPPRFENGSITLGNSFLQAADEPMYLVVNGLLKFPKDLDMELFNEKIGRIDVNGMISIHEEQERYLHGKMDAAPNGVIQVIPAGYDMVKNTLRLNARSIRRFQNQKLWTKKPLIFEADITREALGAAIEKVDSKSYIICSEELEDLFYERLERMETEVLTFEHGYVFVEGEQEWSNDQFLELDQSVNLIVEGTLVLNSDVEAAVLRDKVAAIDLFGEIQVGNVKLSGTVQNKIRTGQGRIKGQHEAVKNSRAGLQNIGELTL